ncbi:TlpA family protein disulfide reductase [Mangrovivirga cuniculi]|uniref:Thioredoxin domain-containing protein n=1 Tax=Mangrovivirga cuniculi TaxID=2715131 RepID=A0A4D7JPS1_9BACT|nr:TlpA disulfide reductase family protein [Mangrovivirga cuniculi]QCK16773.1 hypothetical protein DCC35_19570 [Mangrovivirga cuniculi]
MGLLKYIVSVLMICLFSCSSEKEKQNRSVIDDFHVATTRREAKWDSLESLLKEYQEIILINEKAVSKTDKTEMIMFPANKKLISVNAISGDTMNTIYHTPDRSLMVKKVKGNKLYANIPEEPVYHLIPNFQGSLSSFDTTINDVSYKAIMIDSTIYGFRDDLLRIGIGNSSYGKEITTYTDYKWVSDFYFPFTIIKEFPEAGYKVVSKFNEIKINPDFVEGDIELGKISRKIEVGERIIDYSIPSLKDTSVNFTNADFSGQVYLIDFWATWCKPCIAEFPDLEKLYTKYSNDGFSILSVSLDESRTLVDNFRNNKYQLPWRHGWIQEGFESETAIKFEVISIPKVILVDRKGEIIAIDEDARGDNLERKIKEILN